MILEKETVIIQQGSTSHEIEEATKTASNFLSIDNSGIMVADMSNGASLPSSPSGKNVFINNSTVNIRDGSDVLASFGEKIHLYSGSNYTIIDSDGISLFADNTQVASFNRNSITLGSTNSGIKNVITNTMMAFQTVSGENVAYFGLNNDGLCEMHIGMTFAEKMLRFGDYAWESRENGNMSLKWLGV